MEFKINEVQLPEKISFNYEELKQELQEKARFYASIVYGDDEIKQAKEDKAKLNKLKKALNDERIRQEREYMKPFNEFKEQVNEIIGIIDKPVAVIDEQVKGYEEKQKAEKHEKIMQYWANTEIQLPIPLALKQIFNEKWLNSSFTMKKVQEAISERLAQIAADVKTLESLPEFSFEALEVYKTTLDLNKAIAEGQKLADIQKRKAEAAAVKPAVVASTPTAAEQDRTWLRFEALLTVDQATALKGFFERNNISFRAI